MNNTESIALINKYRGQIMGFSALWVIVYHTWYRLAVPETSPKLLYYIELAISKMGYFGVDIFFLLSGIGLSYAIVRHGTKQYLLRRFRRLAYPVLIAAAVQAIMDGWSFPHYLLAVSGIGFFIKYRPLHICFLWVISAITATYLLFPIYWRFFSRSRSKPRFTALFIVAWYLCSIPMLKVFRPVVFMAITRVPTFVLGVLLGWQQQNGGLKLSRRTFNTAALLSAAVGIPLGWLAAIHNISFFRFLPNGFIPGILVAFGLTTLLAELFGLLDRAGRATRAINKFFGFYGKMSLDLYCTHEYIAPILVQALWNAGIVGLAVNLIEIAVFTLAGWLLHIIADRATRLTDRLISSAKTARQL